MENNNGYIHYNSLNTIIQDLYNTIRNSNIAESENISKNQVEQWVHQYRSILLKQDLDKGRYINQTYIQEVNGLLLQASNTALLAGLTDEGIDVLVSSVKIPKTIDLQFKSGIVSLTTVEGYEIQILPESRALRQLDRKWTKNDVVAFMKEDRLYIIGTDELEVVNMKCLFEIPTEVETILTNSGYIDYNRNEAYQIPATMIPAMKEMILAKELNIITNESTDIVNDGAESASLAKQEYAKAAGARRAK